MALAAQGFTVFASVRKEADALSLHGEGLPTLRPVRLDVTDPATVHSAKVEIDAWLSSSGQQLVGLVNNAGISYSGPVEVILLEKYLAMHEVLI